MTRRKYKQMFDLYADFANLSQKARAEQSLISQEFLAVKRVVDSLNPQLAQITQKVLPIKAGLSQSAEAIKTLKQSFQGFLKEIGQNLGYALMGQSGPGFNIFGGRNMMGLAFKMLAGSFGGGRAMGGNVGNRQAYLVGEKGPELFVPHQAGNIVPNHKLDRPRINMVMNIQTPDAGSFRASRDQLMAIMVQMMRRAVRNL